MVARMTDLAARPLEAFFGDPESPILEFDSDA
jgi:hypothetical protein